jgi:predicted nuclease of restriction endonuclease-like (RecB) superfamily
VRTAVYNEVTAEEIKMSKLMRYNDDVMVLKNAILQSRYRAAQASNKEQLMLYYSIGWYVSVNTRTGKWGTGAIKEISRQLQLELPGLRGYSATNMRYMRIFFEEWTDTMEPNRHLSSGDLKDLSNYHLSSDDLQRMADILNHHLPSDDLSQSMLDAFLRVGFTHHREILAKCKSEDERWYYIMRCASEFWSVDRLKEHIKADDFVHEGALPNNFELTIPDKKLVARAVRSFKDEYLLDYINIDEDDDPEIIDERVHDLQIISDIKKFIITFGEGFCPVNTKHRVIVDDEEFFVDILLFNRNLNCLVAVELKRGSFKPAYLGQLNFYLSALDEYVKKPHENNSIGLLLCKDTKKSIVELAVRDFKKPMGVAAYRTLKNIPKEYQSLRPLIAGVQEILSANGNDAE